MSEKTTFFMIDRKLLADELWLDEPFTKGQAWVDLIGRANYAETRKIHGENIQVVPRGQIVTSETALASRWKWSRHRVHLYLNALEKLQMIRVKRTGSGTLVTLENYDFYQGYYDTSGHPGDISGTPQGHPGDISGTLNNKVNKENKGNKGNKGGRAPRSKFNLSYEEDKDDQENGAPNGK